MRGAAAILVALAAAGPAAAMTGAQVSALVERQLDRLGVASAPVVAPDRHFPDCDSVPTVAPLAHRWSTVTLHCPRPSWTRAIRTGSDDALSLAPAGAAQALTPPPAPGEHAILRVSLGRGSVITKDDITMVADTTATPPDAFADPQRLIGRRMKQTLGAGLTVLPRHVEQRWLVTAKGPVAIEVSSGGLSVAAPGIAIQNGQLGDLVQIRNRSSGQVIKARVTGVNRVSVTPNMN